MSINAKFLEHLGTLELLLVACFRTKAVKTSSDAQRMRLNYKAIETVVQASIRHFAKQIGGNRGTFKFIS